MPRPSIDLHALALRLSPILGWAKSPKYAAEHAVAALEIPGGGELHLGCNWQGTKLVCHAHLPDDLNKDSYRPYYPEGERPTTEITLSADRADAALANDIRRRLLPGFLRFRGDHEGARQRLADCDARCLATFAQLAQAVGFEPRLCARRHNWSYPVEAETIQTAAGTITCSPGFDGHSTVTLDFTGDAITRLEPLLYQLTQAMRHP